MNGVAWAVHQLSSRIDRRKLVSTTRSPSVAVVSEMAPRWMMASNRRPFSQSGNSAGGTMSESCRLARLRHLPSWPSTSQTTTSARPASFNAATTFDPIKPAPPVTSNICYPALIVDASFAPVLPGRQLGSSCVVKTARSVRVTLPAGDEQLPNGSKYTGVRLPKHEFGFSKYSENAGPGRYPADPHRSLHVDR